MKEIVEKLNEQAKALELLTRLYKSMYGYGKQQHKSIVYAILVAGALCAFATWQGVVYIKERTATLDKKVDDALGLYTISKKNEEALSGYECAVCHIKIGMYLPKTSLAFEEFRGYVRGEARFVKNTQMPKYGADTLNDEALMKMWKKLY